MQIFARTIKSLFVLLNVNKAFELFFFEIKLGTQYKKSAKIHFEPKVLRALCVGFGKVKTEHIHKIRSRFYKKDKNHFVIKLLFKFQDSKALSI